MKSSSLVGQLTLLLGLSGPLLAGPAAASQDLQNPADPKEPVPSAPSETPGEEGSGDEPLGVAAEGPSSQVHRAQLIDGPSDLRVLLEPTEGAPEVSVCMSVEAGAAQDPSASPGAFRMLAEMLLPGGYSHPSSAQEGVVESRGGQSELFVRRDLTTFCTTAPAAELPLALWVTGGRFTRFALTEPARKAALERLADLADRTDEDVYAGRAPARLRQMAFLGSYAYAHPTLPNSTELDAIDLPLLRDLHQEAYVAARSVVTISGGFDPAVAKRLVFEQLAPVRPGRPASPAKVDLVKQTTERFSMAEDASAKTPAVWYGWVAPSGADADGMEIALEAAVSSSRLGTRLVGRGRAAKELSFLADDASGPRLLRLRAVGTSSRSLGTIEKLVETELRSLSTKNLAPTELSALLDARREEQARKLATPSGRALALSEGVLRGLSPEQVLSPLREEQPSISPDDVRTAALTLLAPDRRSTVEIYPKGWQDPWQTPMPTYHIVSSGETLTSIARQHGTSIATIAKMNGISTGKPIYPGDKLKVPRSRKKEVKLRTHDVKRGDTLSGLAVRYGVTARGIAELNGMSLKQPIRTGQTLTIPQSSKGSKETSSSSGGSSSAASSGSVSHVVTSGETLGGIALRYGVRLSALASANGLTTKSMVRVGQTLVIPQGESARRPGAVVYAEYTVKSGDTLSGIAKRHGVTVTEIERANGFNRKRTLKIGQTIKIPKKN